MRLPTKNFSERNHYWGWKSPTEAEIPELPSSIPVFQISKSEYFPWAGRASSNQFRHRLILWITTLIFIVTWERMDSPWIWLNNFFSIELLWKLLLWIAHFHNRNSRIFSISMLSAQMTSSSFSSAICKRWICSIKLNHCTSSVTAPENTLVFI